MVRRDPGLSATEAPRRDAGRRSRHRPTAARGAVLRGRGAELREPRTLAQPGADAIALAAVVHVEVTEQRRHRDRIPAAEELERPGRMVDAELHRQIGAFGRADACWTASAPSLISMATVRATTSPGASPTTCGCQPAMRSHSAACSRHAAEALAANASASAVPGSPP